MIANGTATQKREFALVGLRSSLVTLSDYDLTLRGALQVLGNVQARRRVRCVIYIHRPLRCSLLIRLRHELTSIADARFFVPRCCTTFVYYEDAPEVTLRQSIGVKLVVLMWVACFAAFRACLSKHLVFLLLELVVSKASRKNLSGDSWGRIDGANEAVRALSGQSSWLRAICEISPKFAARPNRKNDTPFTSILAHTWIRPRGLRGTDYCHSLRSFCVNRGEGIWCEHARIHASTSRPLACPCVRRKHGDGNASVRSEKVVANLAVER